jgi:hypothetical protein
MPYALFRVSMVPRRQASLFGQAHGEEPSPDEEARHKAELVRRAFTTYAEFEYRRGRLYLVPVFKDGRFVGSHLSKPAAVRVRASPMPGAEVQVVPDHPRANLFLSLAPDDSSQIVALQDVSTVGRPTALMDALVEHINLSPLADENYDLVSIVIPQKGTYLAAAKENEGRITEVDFSFVVPNIIFLSSDLREELERARDEDGAQVVGYSVKNNEGNVNAESPRLVGLAEDVEQGLGSVIIKIAKKIVYRSDRKVKTVDIENKSAVDEMDEDSFQAAARQLFSRWDD